MEMTIEQALIRAVQAHKAGKLQEAEALYRAILQAQPKHSDANHNLGVIAVSLYKTSTALPLFKIAMEANPSQGQFWLSYVDALIKERQFDDARSVLAEGKKRGLAGEKVNFLEAQLTPILLATNSELSSINNPSASIQQLEEVFTKKEKKKNVSRNLTDLNQTRNPPQIKLKSLLKYYQKGQLDLAKNLATTLTQQYPNHPFGWKVLGALYKQTGKLQDAVVADQKAVEISPNDAEAHSNLGVILQELSRLEDAVVSFKKAIEINPDYAEAHSNLGITLKELGRLDDAETSYKTAVHIKPDFAEAHMNLGMTLQALGRLKDAETSYKQAIAIKPEYAEAHFSLGNTLKELGRLEDAEKSYKIATTIKLDYAFAYNNLGTILKELGQLEEAETSFKKAIAIKSDYAEAHSNLGVTLQELFKLEEAQIILKKAVAIKPDYAEAYYNLGITLKELGRLQDAEESYKKAIAIKLDYALAYNNLGTTLKELGRLQDAEESYKKAILSKPDYAEAHSNLGVILQELRQFDAAVASFDKAFDLNPDAVYLSGMRQYARAFVCDWSTLAKSVLVFESEVISKPTTTPFVALTLVDKPAHHLQSSKNFVDLKWPKSETLGGIAKRTAGGKLRLGFFSADFYYHPVAICLIEQIENHDKSKFELFAFSCKSDVKDPMSERLEAAFDHFIAVDTMSNLEVAQLSRQLGIDIAIDLNGHTKGSRIGIFALRAAPIQVNHLGYPGSMGAEYIDYIISDRNLLPEGSAKYYTEKIAYVPCVWTYDRERQLSDQQRRRAQVGLPEKGFVFTCQNGCQKFQPDVFGIWMDILKAVPTSVLWLMEPSASAIANLKKEAHARGVESDRLVFTKRETVPSYQEKARINRYLASYKLADLFLDTWPYNAGITAIDALCAGLPVLTKAGEAMVARLATSLLEAIDVPELITNTAQEYRDLAVELASDPEKLRIIKDKLQDNKLRTDLFDPARNTRHIESAYAEMYRRYQTGLPPDHIYINP
jgi:protein O-GlcNAc transferase